MNKAQREARKLYDRNKRHVENCPQLSIMTLAKIAIQQDRLYLVIHERADKR